jgi:hypothetical protein
MAAPSPRTRLRRLPKRGRYGTEVVHAVLDAGTICHLGYASPDGPRVIPTLYGRDGDTLFVHGSAASRTLREVGGGSLDVCATVTIMDGIVLARSAFHHSMNYRSAYVVGAASVVEDRAAKLAALETISDHIVPGRWAQVRPPTAKELRVTTVLALPIVEASVKERSGPPGDDEEDLALDVWAGVVPLRLVADSPVPDDLAATRPHRPPPPAYARPLT